MRPFKFGLEKVLDLRRKQEREKARTLALARSQEEEVIAERRTLEARRDEGRERLAVARQQGGAVGHIQNMETVVGCVTEQIRDADARCDEAAQDVTASLRDFRAAYAGRKSLDRLRDRKRAAWQLESLRIEQNTMDEVATNRHIRTGVSPTNGEPRDG